VPSPVADLGVVPSSVANFGGVPPKGPKMLGIEPLSGEPPKTSLEIKSHSRIFLRDLREYTSMILRERVSILHFCFYKHYDSTSMEGTSPDSQQPDEPPPSASLQEEQTSTGETDEAFDECSFPVCEECETLFTRPEGDEFRERLARLPTQDIWQRERAEMLEKEDVRRSILEDSIITFGEWAESYEKHKDRPPPPAPEPELEAAEVSASVASSTLLFRIHTQADSGWLFLSHENFDSAGFTKMPCIRIEMRAPIG
jgi:hypothetical protein